VDVLHGDLEAVEAARLGDLNLGREALHQVLVHDPVRRGEEGEDVRDKVPLVGRHVVPVVLVVLRRREGGAAGEARAAEACRGRHSRPGGRGSRRAGPAPLLVGVRRRAAVFPADSAAAG